MDKMYFSKLLEKVANQRHYSKGLYEVLRKHTEKIVYKQGDLRDDVIRIVNYCRNYITVIYDGYVDVIERDDIRYICSEGFIIVKYNSKILIFKSK